MESRLTNREYEIVLLLAQGLSNKGIARRINVAEGTVKQHLHNIFEKFSIQTRAQLIVMFYSILTKGEFQ